MKNNNEEEGIMFKIYTKEFYFNLKTENTELPDYIKNLCKLKGIVYEGK
jgi:hypothetical protein